jgi:hypothetical protein
MVIDGPFPILASMITASADDGIGSPGLITLITWYGREALRIWGCEI